MRTRLLAVLAAVSLATSLALVGLAPTPAQAVVGGYQVTDGRFGFMASIQYAGTKGSNGHFCGGSVIGTRWILTAAHCIVQTGVKPRDIQVVTGRVNLNKDLAKGQTLKVDRIVVHPRYATEGTYDAALIHVTTRIASPAIRLATPTQNQLERGGSLVKVAGWGANSFLIGGIQAQLKAVDLKTVADSKCGTNAMVNGFKAASEICAEAFRGDSCQGDSGGPLFGNLADGRRIQIGIVSYGLGCATPLFPGVYGEVNNASIYRFITTTIG